MERGKKQIISPSWKPVSVIVPVYNTEKHLRKCLDSILSQTFTDFECILIDDYSTDGCPGICDEYSKKDRRVKVIHNKENTGISSTRKAGLEASCGEYIQYVDSDDWIENRMLEEMYRLAAANNNDIVICDYFFEENGTRHYNKQNIASLTDKILLAKDVLAENVKSVFWNKLVKRDLYLRCSFPEYNRSEDYVVIFQAFFFAKNIGYCNSALYHYCYNSASLSCNASLITEENKNWIAAVHHLKNMFGNNFKRLEPELSEKINVYKLSYIKNRQTRYNIELFKLYPESHFFIFLLLKIFHKIKFALNARKIYGG